MADDKVEVVTKYSATPKATPKAQKAPALKPPPTTAQRMARSERAVPVQVGVDDQPDPEGELRTLKATDIVEFNRLAECEFVHIGLTLVDKAGGAMRVRELTIETAARLDISIETAKRYLLKHSASISEFLIEKGWVRTRPAQPKH
jgi:hypothetical protein